MATKPVSLDPFTRIVNVGWATAKGIAVLEFSYAHNFSHPTITLQGLPFGVPSINLFSNVIYESKGPENPMVENPISPDMLDFLYMWNVPPHKLNGGTDLVFSGTALLFFNLKTIRSQLTENVFTFLLSMPGSGPPQNVTETFYYVWFDFGDPFPGVPPNTYGANVSFDSVWSTEAAAAARAAVLNAHSAYHVEPETFETMKADGLAWSGRVSTYATKLDFPVIPESANPAWDVEGESTANTGTVNSPPFEEPLLAHVVTIKIDTKTLMIEGEMDA